VSVPEAAGTSWRDRRLEGKVAVVTGGSGGLGSAMSETLARAGARVAVLSRSLETAGPVAARLRGLGADAEPLACDVTDADALATAAQRVRDTLGPVDILVNAAGGNHPRATTGAERSFFELEPDALRYLLDLNFVGALQACQAFGRDMTERGEGSIVTISSMASERPLTRVVGYAAAKAALNNFTRWLAVHLAQEYGPGIRVNALAPGFFLTEQNQYLMVEADTGELTPRGKSVVGHTPMGRLGSAQDLASTLLWLVDPATAFVTGAVIPVDGGFSAFSGV
jgi:NAD(P)-dependent dehydrogenase (short-subunit alcohol dehydrogenase family)